MRVICALRLCHKILRTISLTEQRGLLTRQQKPYVWWQNARNYTMDGEVQQTDAANVASAPEKRKLPEDADADAETAPESLGSLRKRLKEERRVARKERKKLKKRSTDYEVGYSDEVLKETSYYIENGLRKVYPYPFAFKTYAKGRWVGQPLLDIYTNEFRAYAPEIYERNIAAGRLTVNNQRITLDYKVQNNDLLTSNVHRHELPVTAQPIEIVHLDDELLAINKPASIPVHPCGQYRHNTLIFILSREHNLKNLHTLHRLDRLTSGLLLFGRTPAKSSELEQHIRDRVVQKQYLCRVVGEFPDGSIECNEPIATISFKIGVSRVSPQGKDCRTTFEKLSYNGTTSLVLCKPLTGRMHQIRVHLQYLGYPIVNDPLYNSLAFGPAKGKGGDFAGKTDAELVAELEQAHTAENFLLEELPAEAPVAPLAPEADANVPPELRFDAAKWTVDENCTQCKLRYRDPSPEDLVMYLHAWKYEGPGWKFETSMPKWVQ